MLGVPFWTSGSGVKNLRTWALLRRSEILRFTQEDETECYLIESLRLCLCKSRFFNRKFNNGDTKLWLKQTQSMPNPEE